MGAVRGVLFVVFFGALVWLAVSHGQQQEVATAGTPGTLGNGQGGGQAQVAPIESLPPVPDSDADLRAQEAARRRELDRAYAEETAPSLTESEFLTPEDAGAADAPPYLAESEAFGQDEDFGGGEGFDTDGSWGDSEGVTYAGEEDERPDWLTMEPELSHAEPVEASAEVGGDVLEPLAGSAGGGVALAPLRSPSSALGNLVLGAVVSGDPQPLNAFLGQGDEVSGAERQLVSTFWSAVIGDLENARTWLERIDVGDGVTSAQLDVLRAAVEGQRTRPIEASYGRQDPLALAMTMALLHQEAEAAVRAGNRFPEACAALSTLLQSEVDAPWKADGERLIRWGERLNNAQDRHRLANSGDWPSVSYEVQSGDNLIGIRQKLLKKHPGLLICTGLIEKVNGVAKYLQPGQVLKVPTTAPNVVVDLDSRVLFYRHGEEVVRAWVVGIGREGHDTPVGTYVVGGKQEKPSWMPIGQPARPFGHPENPLGTRWISWDRNGAPTSYGFHGTNDPSGVGGTVSQGCVRMHNDHVEELYDLLPTGSTIVVQR